MYDEVQPFVTIGTGIDSTAADDISAVTGQNALLSNTSQLFDAYYDIDSIYANYEADGIPTALSNNLVAPPVTPVGIPWYTGVWSDPISASDGTIAWTLTIALSQAHTSAFTLTFVGPQIVTGTVTFKNGNTAVATENLTGPALTFMFNTTRTFDTVIISVTKLNEPYKHARLAEIEFGASETFSSSELVDTIDLIQQADFLQECIPISEMDFSLINIDGKYDLDNLVDGHNKALEKVAVGTPVTLSFTFYDGGVQTTKTMGKYYIVRHDAQEDRLHITAQDPRAILQNRVSAISLATGTTIAVSISTALTAQGVPHVIDPSAQDLHPTEDYVFKRNENLIQQLLYIQQRYQIYVQPDRYGMLHISYGDPTGTGNDITQDTLITYPKPSLATTYNFITIDYGPAGNRQQYDLDMRVHPDDVVKSYALDNPLIMTQTQAQGLAQRIQSYMFSQQYLAEVIGDPDLELYADIKIDGRWSANDPLEYKVQSIEYTYDGGLTMRVEAMR